MRLRWVRRALTVTVVAGALAAAPAVADTSLDPGSPLKQTLRSGDWTFELHGPRTPALQVVGHATEIVVRHSEAGVIALLRPASVLPCSIGGVTGCVPIDLMGRTSAAVKRTRMVVSNHDRFVPPEVSTTFYTGGTRCCYVSVGFWQPQDGPWQTSRLDSGGTEPISDGTGRMRAGDPRWETLDWPPVAARPFYVWHQLVNGEGWKQASTRQDVRTELRRTTTALRRLERQKGAGVRDATRSARGVRLGYQKALGQSKAVASGRRAYRRSYGAAGLRRLDQGLRRVTAARSR